MSNGFDEWGGYMDAKVTKLEEQFSAASAPFRKSELFAGISIFVNGRTDPSADELKRIMMVHGGTYHHYERSHTTYIVAENLPDVKVRQLQHAKKLIISAKWIVDCLKEQRLLDYAKYLLYTNQKTTQPRLEFNKSLQQDTSMPAAPLELADTLQALNKKMLQANNVNASVVKSATSTKTAKDENFLTEFYNNSRLHHIATLGAGFKQHITELRDNLKHKDFTAALEKLKQQLKTDVASTDVEPRDKTCIMHIDMDCFFVSVGLRKHPHLINQPIAVTHSRGGAAATDVPVHANANREVEREMWLQRHQQLVKHDKVQGGFDKNYSLSEIASCSYEARQCGVKNGMFVGQALKLCPKLQTIPYDFEGYKEVAQQLYDTITQYTYDIEAVSCDEMFVDLSKLLLDLQTTPDKLVSLLRQEVRDITACPCSAGVGPNKLLARMATKRAKPDGQFILLAAEAEQYMAPLPLSDLPGVGSSTAYTLKQAGINTCGDLQLLTLPRLQMLVGKKTGNSLREFCLGIDNRPLNYHQVRKSVSAEVNYGIRFTEQEEVDDFLNRLSDEVHGRLMEIKRRTKCVNLKVMVRAKDAPTETAKYMGHGVCDSLSKAANLLEFTNNKNLIRSTVINTMRSMKIAPCELRGLGIQLTKLDEKADNEALSYGKNSIESLFKRVAEQKKLDKTVDKPLVQTTSSNTTKRPAKTEPNIISMLKNAAKKPKPETVAVESVDLTKEDVTDFLGELPQTMRAEVSKSVKQLQELEKSYAAVNEHSEPKEQPEQNIFKRADFEDAVIAWMEHFSSTGPATTDVEIIIKHAKTLVQEEAYLELYNKLKWLCTLLVKKPKLYAGEWLVASQHIMKSVQQEIKETYGLPFYMPVPDTR